MDVIFGVGDGELIRSFDPETTTAIYLGDEPVLDGIDGYRIVTPQCVQAVVQHLYGGGIAAFSLAVTQLHHDHPCGVDEDYRACVVREFIGHASLSVRFWGNSTVDGLHGMYNLAANASRLINAPALVDLKRMDCPAICVGAGPSLAKVMRLLPALRQKCLIVAADTAATKLKEAGCDPHVVTPLERINTTAKKLADYDGDAVFAGLPFVPPDAVKRFKRFLSVGQDDLPCDWAGITDRQIQTGSTSGTLAMNVCSALTSGPIYLVGHDLVLDADRNFSPDVPSSQTHDDATRVVAGNDGQPHPTSDPWAKARDEIDCVCSTHEAFVINVAASLGMGARFNHARDGELPDPSKLRLAHIKLKTGKRQNTYHQLINRGKGLSEDWRKITAAAAKTTDLACMDIAQVCMGRNVPFFAYVMRPLFAQVSVERRLGRPTDQLVALWKQRIANMEREITGVIDQICAMFKESV